MDEKQTAQAVADPSTLVQELDSWEGTNDLYNFLRTRPTAEIERVCATFPIEDIRLEFGDMRSIKRFELITNLAQVLIRYGEILKESAELRLPASLPAKSLSDSLMGRLMPFIAAQQGTNVAQTLRVRLYDFAQTLMLAGRDADALTCFLVSRPSIKEDHEFWIAACRFNVALASRAPDDLAAAFEAANGIASGRVKVPGKYVQGAQQMLTTLQKIKAD